MEPCLEIISYTYILQRTAYVVQQIQCFRFQGETFDSLGSNFVLMHVKIQFSWHHLLNMLFFFFSVYFSFLLVLCQEAVVKSDLVWVFYLFHWSAYLFLCRYHIVFIIMALQYILQSKMAIPPVFLYFAKIDLAIKVFFGSIYI